MPPYGIRNGTTLEQPPDQSSRTPKGKILSAFHFRGTAFDRSVALQWFNQAMNRTHQGGIIGDDERKFIISDCCKKQRPYRIYRQRSILAVVIGLVAICHSVLFSREPLRIKGYDKHSEPLSEAGIFRLKTIVAEPRLIVSCLDVIVFLSEHND